MPTLEKTSHWNVHLTGEDADKINLEEILTDSGYKIEITSASVSTYYKKPDKKETSIT